MVQLVLMIVVGIAQVSFSKQGKYFHQIILWQVLTLKGLFCEKSPIKNMMASTWTLNTLSTEHWTWMFDEWTVTSITEVWYIHFICQQNQILSTFYFVLLISSELSIWDLFKTILFVILWMFYEAKLDNKTSQLALLCIHCICEKNKFVKWCQI